MENEDIFRLILQREWKTLIDWLHKNPNEPRQNPVLEGGVRTFVSEFVKEVEAAPGDVYLDQLVTLFALHTDKAGRGYRLDDDDFEKVVVALVRHEKRLSMAVAYARALPQNVECAAVIKAYQEQRDWADAEERKQTRHSGLRVTETVPAEQVDYRTRLFKSQQEVEFFDAAAKAFPHLTVYPNVAVSTIVDFEKIQGQLTEQERTYFFRALIDCVVFDRLNDFLPLFFFELDSNSYHDSQESRRRDAMKDRILSLAGQKLYRVRKTSPRTGEKEFIRLIREAAKEGGAE